jgi:AraC-like DNA-binding protein
MTTDAGGPGAEDGGYAALMRLQTRFRREIERQVALDLDGTDRDPPAGDPYLMLRVLSTLDLSARRGRGRGLSAADIADGLAQIVTAREQLASYEGVLLAAARARDADGRYMLSWRGMAERLGYESEQAAVSLYKRRVGRSPGRAGASAAGCGCEDGQVRVPIMETDGDVTYPIGWDVDACPDCDGGEQR